MKGCTDISDMSCSVEGCERDGHSILTHPDNDGERRIYCNTHTGVATQHWGAEQPYHDNGFPVLIGGPTSYIPTRARDPKQATYSVIECPKCGGEAFKIDAEPIFACRSCKVGSNILFRDANYGPRWAAVRKWVLDRDGYSCCSCGCSDEPLDVHHRKKLVYFDRVEEANQPENLVSVCEECHGEIETPDEPGVVEPDS